MELAISFDPLALQFAGATTCLVPVWGVGFVWVMGLMFSRPKVLVASEAFHEAFFRAFSHRSQHQDRLWECHRHGIGTRRVRRGGFGV